METGLENIKWQISEFVYTCPKCGNQGWSYDNEETVIECDCGKTFKVIP